MPTKREREYYRMGFHDGLRMQQGEPRLRRPRFTDIETVGHGNIGGTAGSFAKGGGRKGYPKKRKLSAWNKYVKTNSKKPRFRYRNGKLNLKKMAIAFRKTPAGKKKRR